MTISELRCHGVRDHSVNLYWRERVVLVLLLIVVMLILAGLIANTLRFGFGLTSGQTLGFIKLFDLNHEQNLPTWFSSMLLASCALLLALIAFAKRMVGDLWFRYWFGLSGIFVLLSLDEVASIHERFSHQIHNIFELSPVFTNAWVLVAWPLLGLFLLLYIKFIWNLPRRSRWLFVLSGAVFVGGASGIEVLSGLTKYNYGTADLRFALMTTLEEALEMLGIVAFIYALIDYAGREQLTLRLTFIPAYLDAEVTNYRIYSRHGQNPHNQDPLLGNEPLSTGSTGFLEQSCSLPNESK